MDFWRGCKNVIQEFISLPDYEGCQNYLVLPPQWPLTFIYPWTVVEIVDSNFGMLFWKANKKDDDMNKMYFRIFIEKLFCFSKHFNANIKLRREFLQSTTDDIPSV